MNIGEYIVHTPNYAHFTLMSAKKEGPTFTDARLFTGTLNGDTVRVCDDREPAIQLVSRAKHPALAGIIELASKTLYGMTSRNVPIYLFRPFDRRYPPFRVGCSERDRTVNRLAIVAFEDWTAGQTLPRGALVQLLGVAGDFNAERIALQHTASPFWSHKAFMGHPIHIAPPKRPLLDASDGWTLCNVDPAGCRDIDDVIGFRGDEVVICIADVDAVVQADTTLDHYASLTAQTIYEGGVAVRPMLPPTLSEGICSLIPGEIRPVLALRATIRGGALHNVHFQSVNITNGQSYTYEEAQEALKGLFSPLMDALGYVEVCETDSHPSHDWIAEAMKFYNLEAAKLLMARGSGILRAHSGPKAEKMAALTSALGHLAGRFASEAAAYVPVAAGATHFGMDNRPYCHATSPIRRYADLVNQRIIKGTYTQALDLNIYYNLNVRSKAAKEHERAIAFMQALNVTDKIVDVVIVDSSRAYVPAWSRIIRLANEKAAGTEARVRYFYDASKARWKDRMVFEIVTHA